MPKSVLILGNGISRLLFDKKIREWTGEIWGCNRVYLDYGDKLTLLYGHSDVVREGGIYRDKNRFNYRLAGTNEFPLQCDRIYRKDSGTTLAAEALSRGYNIILCGFDMGGPDVYSPGMVQKNKTMWVKRWVYIFHHFPATMISWWGHDHTNMILYGEKTKYSHDYLMGKSHLPEKDYQELLKTFQEQNVLERIPCVMLHNIGKRAWTFPEFDRKRIGENESLKVPQVMAEKYRASYPKDFEILPIDKSITLQ